MGAGRGLVGDATVLRGQHKGLGQLIPALGDNNTSFLTGGRLLLAQDVPARSSVATGPSVPAAFGWASPPDQLSLPSGDT